LAQDDYYYEIQLTNKQLVFYFMAGAAGLILSFLAGVMVGRGVDGATAGTEAARPVTEERVVAEEATTPPPPTPAEMSYPQRLEAERTEEALERSRPVASSPSPAPRVTPSPKSVASPTPVPARPSPAAPRPTPSPVAAGSPGAPPRAPAQSSPGFAVQVGAFRDRASADTIVGQLKGRGFSAYTVAPAERGGGLFTVRVGPYRDRADAEQARDRLREEKFNPYVIRQ